MTAVIFLGPSLSHDSASRALDAVYLPPAAQGDVYRAVKQYNPKVVAIVDGYFRALPSVWHKEILWAMHQGVQVLGGASMGALRAAELADFGMEGVGEIFEAYRCGRFAPFDTLFEDDDEVAVVHGPAEAGYVCASAAMVNIRATLASAAQNNVISANTRNTIAETAKSIFYPERNYKRLLVDTREKTNLEESEIRSLEKWLPEGMIDQKKLDAEAVLARASALLESGKEKSVNFHFEHTDLWHGLTQEGPTESEPTSDPALDQLRVEPLRYETVRRAAHYRKLAIEEAARQGMEEISPRELRDYRTAFRQALGLIDGKSFQAWLASNQLNNTDLDRLLCEELTITSQLFDPNDNLNPEILDELRLAGEYAPLLKQARRREKLLSENNEPDAGSVSVGQIADWYFETIAQQSRPTNLETYALEQGFTSFENFIEVARGAYLNMHADVNITQHEANRHKL